MPAAVNITSATLRGDVLLWINVPIMALLVASLILTIAVVERARRVKAYSRTTVYVVYGVIFVFLVFPMFHLVAAVAFQPYGYWVEDGKLRIKMPPDFPLILPYEVTIDLSGCYAETVAWGEVGRIFGIVTSDLKIGLYSVRGIHARTLMYRTDTGILLRCREDNFVIGIGAQ